MYMHMYLSVQYRLCSVLEFGPVPTIIVFCPMSIGIRIKIKVYDIL